MNTHEHSNPFISNPKLQFHSIVFLPITHLTLGRYVSLSYTIPNESKQPPNRTHPTPLHPTQLHYPKLPALNPIFSPPSSSPIPYNPPSIFLSSSKLPPYNAANLTALPSGLPTFGKNCILFLRAAINLSRTAASGWSSIRPLRGKSLLLFSMAPEAEPKAEPEAEDGVNCANWVEDWVIGLGGQVCWTSSAPRERK